MRIAGSFKFSETVCKILIILCYLLCYVKGVYLIKFSVLSFCQKGSMHRVHIGVEKKQGEYICPLNWSVHHNFVRDGRYTERVWACTPTPPPSPVWTNFSIMMEWPPESVCCHFVCTLCLKEFVAFRWSEEFHTVCLMQGLFIIFPSTPVMMISRN